MQTYLSTYNCGVVHVLPLVVLKHLS